LEFFVVSIYCSILYSSTCFLLLFSPTLLCLCLLFWAHVFTQKEICFGLLCFASVDEVMFEDPGSLVSLVLSCMCVIIVREPNVGSFYFWTLSFSY
jgi:hypothetical protein